MVFIQIPSEGVLIFINLTIFLVKDDGYSCFIKSLILSSFISANTSANRKHSPSFPKSKEYVAM